MRASTIPAPAAPGYPVSDYVWDASMGADHSTIVTSDPVVRISREGRAPGRKVGRPKKNARRNTIDFMDPIDRMIKRAEGNLEMKGFYQLYRDPDVVKVEPQYGPCPYVGASGTKRETFWDARVTYVDGERVVQAYRPATSAAKKNYADEVFDMFRQMPETVCDRAALVTDRDLPAWASANGRLIHSVLCQGHWTMLAEMTEAAETMSGAPVTIEDFCLPHGGVGRTFRTAVYLIAKRVLWAPPGLIARGTFVARYDNQDENDAR
jgi:hypothetical protein